MSQPVSTAPLNGPFMPTESSMTSPPRKPRNNLYRNTLSNPEHAPQRVFKIRRSENAEKKAYAHLIAVIYQVRIAHDNPVQEAFYVQCAIDVLKVLKDTQAVPASINQFLRYLVRTDCSSISKGQFVLKVFESIQQLELQTNCETYEILLRALIQENDLSILTHAYVTFFNEMRKRAIPFQKGIFQSTLLIFGSIADRSSTLNSNLLDLTLAILGAMQKSGVQPEATDVFNLQRVKRKIPQDQITQERAELIEKIIEEVKASVSSTLLPEISQEFLNNLYLLENQTEDEEVQLLSKKEKSGCMTSEVNPSLWDVRGLSQLFEDRLTISSHLPVSGGVKKRGRNVDLD